MTRTPQSLGLPALALAAVASVACSKPWTPYAAHPCARPDLSGCVIQDVSVTGNPHVPAAAIKDKIATAETSHSLGGVLEDVPILSVWDRITVDYETLDPLVLERDLARVERLYRARGYYDAHARAARVTKPSKERVKVEIVVEEGPPVLVGGVHLRLDWDAGGALPPSRVLDAVETAAAPVKPGALFAESMLEDPKKTLARALTDHGFAYAKVQAKAQVDLITHRAEVSYVATLGPPTKFGAITIDGAGELPVERVRRAIAIEPGQPFSTARLESAQIALGDLRVFGTVDALPQLTPDDKPASERVTDVPVVFRVTPTALKTAKAGFGFEVGDRVGVHGVTGWENRNFFGGLRSFTVEAKPGIVFFPYTLITLFSGSVPTNFKIVPELRVHAGLVQPGFVEARTRGVVSADFNMYQLQPTDTLGYFELTGKTGVERDWWTGRVKVSFYSDVQLDQPLQLQLPGLASEPCGGGYHFVVIPYLQTVGTLDLRRGVDGKRDAINPHSGFYFSNDLQLAAGPSSTDIRVRPEARGYVPVSKRVTLALRVAGGILHAFGGDLAKTPEAAQPYSNTAYTADEVNAQLKDICAMQAKQPEPPGRIVRSSYIQILQLRGFNSGGTNSNRGYAYNGVGPQEQILGISALNTVGSQQDPAFPKDPTKTLPTGVPLPIATGGKALWEASIELRFPIRDQFGATVFVDGSDVRDSFAAFGAPFAPHLSTGLGIRYATPVGPLRVDFGVRIPGAQVIGKRCAVFDPTWPVGTTPPQGCFLDPTYGQAGSISGVPIALSLAIGEAF